MTTLRSTLGSLVVVIAAVTAAALIALFVNRAMGAPAPIVPLAAATLIASLFAWRPIEGLLAFVTFALVADTAEHWLNLDLLLFDEIGLLLLIGAALLGRRLQPDRILWGWPEAGLLVFVVAAVASSLVNEVPLLTWAPGLFLLLKAVAFFYLVRWLAATPEEAVNAGAVVLIVAGGIAALGFVEWLNPSAFQQALRLPEYGQVRGDVPVLRSIFLHPALFGWLTAFASLLCYARFLTHRSWWAVPLALGLNVGSFLSGRRTPLLGVAAALAVGLAIQSIRLGARRSVTRIWLPAAAVLVLLMAFAGPSIGRLAAITAFEYGPSMEAATEIFAEQPRADVIAGVHPRVALYAGSMAIARDEFPLGGGVGRFGSHLSREDYSPLYTEYGLDQVALLGPDSAQAATDAFWPMILGETGVLGLIGALGFFLGIGILLARGAARAASTTLQLVAAAALFVFIESLIRSATSSVFVAPPIAYFAMGAAGLAFSAIDTRNGARPVRDAVVTPAG